MKIFKKGFGALILAYLSLTLLEIPVLNNSEWANHDGIIPRPRHGPSGQEQRRRRRRHQQWGLRGGGQGQDRVGPPEVAVGSAQQPPSSPAGGAEASFLHQQHLESATGLVLRSKQRNLIL